MWGYHTRPGEIDSLGYHTRVDSKIWITQRILNQNRIYFNPSAIGPGGLSIEALARMGIRCPKCSCLGTDSLYGVILPAKWFLGSAICQTIRWFLVYSTTYSIYRAEGEGPNMNRRNRNSLSHLHTKIVASSYLFYVYILVASGGVLPISLMPNQTNINSV